MTTQTALLWALALLFVALAIVTQDEGPHGRCNA